MGMVWNLETEKARFQSCLSPYEWLISHLSEKGMLTFLEGVLRMKCSDPGYGASSLVHETLSYAIH